MPRSSVDVLNSFQQRLNRLEHTRKKQEALLSKGQLVLRDIEEVYAAIFLNMVVSFEAFIEELFVGLLAGQVQSKHSRVNARVKIHSHLVARALVLRGRNFFNWLPYENTENAAKTFFTGGRPFTLLTDDDKERLSKCFAIRHAIAHRSRYAVKVFRSKALAGLTLAPRDRKPTSFLRCEFSRSPPANYYQHYTTEVLNIARKLH